MRPEQRRPGASYQSLVGHVGLVLQLNQPPLQLVPGPLRLLPQLLLSLQALPLHLRRQAFGAGSEETGCWAERPFVSLLAEWPSHSLTCFLALSSLA